MHHSKLRMGLGWRGMRLDKLLVPVLLFNALTIIIPRRSLSGDINIFIVANCLRIPWIVEEFEGMYRI